MEFTTLSLGTSQNVAFTTASTQSSAIGTTNNGRVVVRVYVSADCHIESGASPTANTQDAFFPAGSVEYVEVMAGHRLAIIGATSSGFATITQVV